MFARYAARPNRVSRARFAPDKTKLGNQQKAGTMPEITLDSFASATTEQAANTDRGEFKAPKLTAEIKDAEGNLVATVNLEPRAYTPNDKGKGGVGWFGQIAKSDPAKYRGTVPLTGQVRLSVSGLKIAKGETVNFK